MAEFVDQEGWQVSGFWWSPIRAGAGLEEANHEGVDATPSRTPLKQRASASSFYYHALNERNVKVRLGVVGRGPVIFFFFEHPLGPVGRSEVPLPGDQFAGQKGGL